MADQRCIMVVGAHAHDPEVMGGAAVLKHVDAGWRAVIVHLTLGEKGHPALSPQEYAKIKAEEAHEAARRLGAECVILPYLDGELPVSEAAQWHIADAIRKDRPNVLLTHWKGSFHTDHRNTYHNVMASLFYAGLKTFVREHPAFSPGKVLFCENWEDIEDFVPDTYLDVTEVWDRFIHAMRAYSLFRGEVAKFPYEQWYQGASIMRGAEAGFQRAVAMMKPESVYTRRRPVQDLLI
jgi:LmbE family N-acetylglucosaminyl deacetylase